MTGKEGVKSINWHLTARCNYNCKFCFSQNLDSEIKDLNSAINILKRIKAFDIKKINFVGGEPLLHPLFSKIIKVTKNMNFVVSIVSNGFYLNKSVIVELAPFIDWIGLSVDSAYEEIEMALGRGNGNHVKHITELADIIHEFGIKLKINTTVTRLNWKEDMRPLLRRLKPDRWKVFQVLHISGQNDQFFDELSITDEQFDSFKLINQQIEGIIPVFENNYQMIDSYFMLSPSGMVMSNREGTNRVLIPLERIANLNFSIVMDPEKYLDRGAIYDWNSMLTT